MSLRISLLLLPFLVALEISSRQSRVYATPTYERRDELATSVGAEQPVVKDLRRNSLKPPCSCVLISLCRELYEIFEKGQSRTSEEEQKLQSSIRQCGESREALTVCCNDHSNTVLPNTPLKFSKCGDNVFNNNTRERLVGHASRAKLGAWPWMVAIYARNFAEKDTKFICGGSLISSEWVLTAAHCIPKSSLGSLSYVVVGDLDLNDTVEDGADPKRYRIAKVFTHPQYSLNPILNDIALLRLRKQVKYNFLIQPICLHSDQRYLNDSFFYHNKKPTIIGWGTVNITKEGQTLSTTRLMEAQIPVVNTTVCQKNYNKIMDARIDESFMCAGADGTDSCQGDSGGPLMFRDPQPGIWSQGGIVSFGHKCGLKDYPGVYTRVPRHIGWIEKTTKLKF